MTQQEIKIAHLGFIQGVINRMGGNSFIIKGWSVTLVAAAMALSSKDSNGHFIYIPYVTVLAFWALDSYYLHQEKLYRKLYEIIANDTLISPELTMDTSKINKTYDSLYKTWRSPTILAFHLPLLFLVIAFTVVLTI